jgi:hypothetical protein
MTVSRHVELVPSPVGKIAAGAFQNLVYRIGEEVIPRRKLWIEKMHRTL